MNMNVSTLSLLERERLFRLLRVGITHHSNAMEGTTLSFDETKNLLENGTTAPNKPLSEHLARLLQQAQSESLQTISKDLGR